ncbi:hypothetical protein PCANC_03813 [Puccinia coronata f. sp. avenae]|uniref:Uncharacterized protein n=1 Tax=Puccinia coronata f. sp. avenae TaxID=200324 RepID=A0A2N5T7C3_9BASI|nr:hypothetical protein PCANC_03813 [Puccinia coronata f. sp. avenae]
MPSLSTWLSELARRLIELLSQPARLDGSEFINLRRSNKFLENLVYNTGMGLVGNRASITSLANTAACAHRQTVSTRGLVRAALSGWMDVSSNPTTSSLARSSSLRSGAVERLDSAFGGSR